MSDTLSGEIARLNQQIDKMEEDCNQLAVDEGTVVLQEYHGEYLLKFDRMEYEIDGFRRKVEDMTEKRKTIDEVRLVKELEQKQAAILGGVKMVKAKDTLIFFLILFVLSLLAMEIYQIGAPGNGARIEPVINDGKIVDVNILQPGMAYSAAEIVSRAGNKYPTGDAILLPVVTEGKLSEVKILFEGSGYQADHSFSVVPDFSKSTHWTFWWLDTICCIIFMANFIFELRLSSSKKWYWKRNWIDFLTSLPFPPLHLMSLGGEGINAIRAGRILRVIRILRAFRVLRMFLFFWRGLDHLSTIMDVKLLKKSLAYGLIAMLAGAMIFMSLERVEDGDGSFLESLWWSFTTLVTGGFADIHNPATMGGKILTVMLVIGGMVLVGVFTATLTSVLVREDDSWQRDDVDVQLSQMSGIENKLESIEQELKNLKAKQSEDDGH